jgi:hypothetical protein
VDPVVIVFADGYEPGEVGTPDVSCPPVDMVDATGFERDVAAREDA